MAKLLSQCCVAMAGLLTVLASAQVVSYQQEWVRVEGMQFEAASSTRDNGVLKAALQTIFRDPSVCCGKYSSLVDAAESANAESLQDVAAKLQGRHVLGDGRPIVIRADYLQTSTVSGKIPAGANLLIPLEGNHPLLTRWNGHLYVIYGAQYTALDEAGATDSASMNAVNKIEMFDPQTGQHVVFDRAKDDWNQVEGLIQFSVGASPS